MNVVIFHGRLVNTPVRKYTIDNKPVTNFTLAVPRKVKVEGKPTADFIDCTAWNVHAENIFNTVNQGDAIMVKGRLENNNYVNSAGIKVYSQVVIVEEWDYGAKKRNDIPK